jgi:hypothetical protein
MMETTTCRKLLLTMFVNTPSNSVVFTPTNMLVISVNFECISTHTHINTYTH